MKLQFNVNSASPASDLLTYEVEDLLIAHRFLRRCRQVLKVDR